MSVHDDDVLAYLFMPVDTCVEYLNFSADTCANLWKLHANWTNESCCLSV